MTRKEKLDLYWNLYTVAKGLDVLMTPDLIHLYNYPLKYKQGADVIPEGLCDLLWDIHGYYMNVERFQELMDLRPKNYYYENYKWGAFWFKPGDWKVRSKILLNILNDLYK